MRRRCEFRDDAVVLVSYFLNIKLCEKKIFLNTIRKIVAEKYFDKPQGKELKRLLFLDANGIWEELVFDNEAAYNTAQDILKRKSAAEKRIIIENRIFSLQVLHEKESYSLSEFFLLHCFVSKGGKEEDYYEMLLKDEDTLFSLITVSNYKECLTVMEQYKKKVIEKLENVIVKEKLLNRAERKRMLRAVQTENFTSLQGLEDNEMKKLAVEIKKSL
ncbi:MAG: hypothetical protein LBQ88_15225 [Treponema sp.]|jgi:hypothetical protein|nr:hypothetical protein [Treponema sp.]